MTSISVRTLADLRRDPRFPASDWLSAAERETLEQFRHPASAERWRAGRWMVKRLVCEMTGARSSEIEIVSRDGLNRPLRPRVVVSGRVAPWDVAISHDERQIAVAVTRADASRIGLDLVDAEADQRPNTHWDQLWFSCRELELISSQALSPARMWSAKEAAYKATNRGEKFTPRSIEIEFVEPAEFIARRIDRPAECQLTLHERPGCVVVLAETSSP